MKVRPGAVLRGVGVALACVAPAGSKRSGILFAAYTGGWFLDKPGLQVFMVVPDTDEPWKRGTVPFATSVASWSTVMLAAATGLRRTRVPTPIGAVLLGGVVTVVDSLLADLGAARDAAKAAAEADGAPAGY
ncbi:hypothetical protein EKO23_14090 [Nocardioides guangzhouensis]|uniref:Uncharacterized protein n=1 Tax=Nocardioides guangzhouensis TaxID=2497878 RepID=A0A4Q4ZAC6_9ACTN|nr:hypothetical protein [Nocardioides guangzhouensis]RYP84900.1 hypothetical protein EKO23_14090 [Nocardioides guangzhouensis]